jgi:SulP family sulfate permease
MILSAFLFMRRMAEMTTVATGDRGDEEGGEKAERLTGALPKGVDVYRVSGPLFFGAADKLGEVLSHISDPPKVFILRLGAVPVVDATGLHALRDFQSRCRRLGTSLLLCGLQPQPLRVLKSTGALSDFDAWTEDDDLPAALKLAAKAAGR